MTEGWRKRQAQCDEFHALRLYQHAEPFRVEVVGEPPVVFNIDDDLLKLWGVREDGLIAIPLTDGRFIYYDVIGSDVFRMSWVAIRQEPQPE